MIGTATYTKSCTIDGIAVLKVYKPENIGRNITGFVGFNGCAGYVGVKADGAYTDIYENAFQAARATKSSA